MIRVVVIGAGLSGCTVACTLADSGAYVTLIEKTGKIGGKVRSYGCKSVNRCLNCGVCLTAGLWDKVSNHSGIRVMTGAEVSDITGSSGDFTVHITSGLEVLCIGDIYAIVVSTGFDSQPTGAPAAHMHVCGASGPMTGAELMTGAGLITGAELEEVMLNRTRTKLFEKAPQSVAFIQCAGSRDKNEGGLYCSRVCCSYSTRAAKVIRSYYPDCEIVFFYMEMQNVEAGNYFTGLLELSMEFIKCRPAKIIGGKRVTVEYDDPVEGVTGREFDLVVLSEGIHACTDNHKLAEVCNLGQDKDGFMQAIGAESGVYVTGCAKSPMKIDETCADSKATASRIIGCFSGVRG